MVTRASPTFSPDGEQVAFSWDGGVYDNSDIYVKIVGSSEVRRLTTDPAFDDDAQLVTGRAADRLPAVPPGADRGPHSLVSPLGGSRVQSSVISPCQITRVVPDGRVLAAGRRINLAIPAPGFLPFPSMAASRVR